MRFYAYLAIVASLYLAGFGSAWWLQGLLNDSKEKERVEKEFVQAKADAATAVRRTDNGIIAHNNAASLERSLRRSVAANRDALVRLLNASEVAVADARASHAACFDRATALREVFGQCSKEYVSLGEAADRHTIDIRTLTKASEHCFKPEE